MAEPFQKGAVGARLELRAIVKGSSTVRDVSSATVTKNIVWEKPSGTQVTNAGSFTTDGTDGKIEYTTTAATELDEVGIWKARIGIDMTGYNGNSEWITFQVE